MNALLSPLPGISFLRDTKRVGDFSEVMVIAALSRAGYIVSLPLGENHRYDLIVDKDGVLSRVQVKTGRVRNGAMIFNCHSCHSHRNGPSCRSYIGQVEYFGVYCPALEACYLVPISDTATFWCTLRLAPSSNGQRRRVRWASPYLLSPGLRTP